jgi:hypothetical protein
VALSKIPGRCPKCGSNNIQAEPLYPYEADEYDWSADSGDAPGDLAVFCVSCGHYLGEMDSELFDRMRAYRRQLAPWLSQKRAE